MSTEMNSSLQANPARASAQLQLGCQRAKLWQTQHSLAELALKPCRRLAEGLHPAQSSWSDNDGIGKASVETLWLSDYPWTRDDQACTSSNSLPTDVGSSAGAWPQFQHIPTVTRASSGPAATKGPLVGCRATAWQTQAASCMPVTGLGPSSACSIDRKAASLARAVKLQPPQEDQHLPQSTSSSGLGAWPRQL